MRLIVLGAAAGGGFPQWNCACEQCQRAFSENPHSAEPRAQTQSSIAVTVDGDHWFLFNASPDLRQQILATPALHPHPRAGEKRQSPLVGAVLTNADVDHIAGLLTLRESHPLSLSATPRVLSVLRANSVFNVLNPALVSRHPLMLDHPQQLALPDGRPSGLEVTLFSVPGKIALWLEDPTAAQFGSVPEDTVGVRLRDCRAANTPTAFYIPGCASVPPELAERLCGADLLLFDGTTYTDDEMIAQGLGHKTAARMGHMAISGDTGSLATFSGLGIARKVYIHINNSNPILTIGSPARRMVEDAGWAVASDGQEYIL